MLTFYFAWERLYPQNYNTLSRNYTGFLPLRTLMESMWIFRDTSFRYSMCLTAEVQECQRS